MSDPIGALRAGLAQFEGGATQGLDSLKKFEFDLGKGQSKSPAGGSSFADTLTRAVNDVSDAQDRSSDMVQRFLRGEPVELHQVMAATEEAGIALDLLVELRNKVTDAYRTLINMQS